MYQVMYNGRTNHLSGVTERTQSEGRERGGVVQYYAQSACAQVTKGGLAAGQQFDHLEDAIKALKLAGGRPACKRCLAAAEAELKQQEADKVAEDELRGAHPLPSGNILNDSEVLAEALADLDATPVTHGPDYEFAEFERRRGSELAAKAPEPALGGGFAEGWAGTDKMGMAIRNADNRCQAQPIHRAQGVEAVAEIVIGDAMTKACRQCADHYLAGTFCQYSAGHSMDKVPADTVLDCRPVGFTPACQECADLYARLSGR